MWLNSFIEPYIFDKKNKIKTCVVYNIGSSHPKQRQHNNNNT